MCVPLVPPGEGCEHLVHIIALAKCACRTMGDTLATKRAASLFDADASVNAYIKARSAILDIPNVTALDLCTDLNTPETSDAFCGIANERKSFVPSVPLDVLFKRNAEDVELLCQLL